MRVSFQHGFDFDPSYGMSLKELLAIEPPAPPDDFAAFWRARHARALAVDPAPELKRSATTAPGWRVLDLVYRSTDDIRIGGWLLLPESGVVRRGLVVGHGYGGRDGPDLALPVRETAVLFPCLRGMSRSACASISSNPLLHVVNGIESRDTYVIGGCVDDVWAGVSTLVTLYPWLDGHVGYIGASFGGGVGAFAVAFDRRIDRGHLVVPTFGHQSLRLELPTSGSGAAVQAYERRRGGVMATLKYYDAATAALFVDVPMLTAVARFDPSVAPPGQFAVANALSRKGNETVILDAGHFDYPDMARQNAGLTDKLREFFAPP